MTEMADKLKNYSCEGQISIFDYMHESIPNFDTMSIKDAADRIGKKLELEFKESYRYGDENENAVEYTAKNKKLKIDIYFSHYVDTVNDGRRFLSVDIENARHEGFTSPCESIEEAIEVISRQMKVKQLCQHSGHTCNKTELWKLAGTLDDIKCPHKCCRECNITDCGVRCNGAPKLPIREPCNKPCDCEWGSLTCFTRRGYIRNNDGQWVRDKDGTVRRTKLKECDWEPEEIYELDIKGLCDDPVCPKCGYEFWTEPKRNEVDMERCPECGIRVSWRRWHKMN